MTRLLLAILLPLSFVLPAGAEAGFITIETTTSTAVQNDVPKISVSVRNKGDEPAHNVRINVIFASKQYPGKLKDVLDKGLSYTEEFSPEAGFTKAGRYPFLINVSYTDANLYPFSALSVSYMNYKGPLDCMITASIPAISISGKGRVGISAKNIDTRAIKFKYELIAPKEFRVKSPKGEITAGPGIEKAITVNIENISALAGSKYPVFALLSYEDDKYYYSTIASGNINVGKRDLLTEYKVFLIAIIAILVLAVVSYNVLSAKNRVKKT